MSPVGPIEGATASGVVSPDSSSHGNHTAAAGSTTNPGFFAVYNAAIANAQPTALSGGSAHAHAGAASGASLPTSGNPSALLGQSHQASHNVQEIALGLRAYRQQLIASNIANADTPGYKAVDIDFPEALKQAQSASGLKPIAMAVTAAGHLSGQISSSPNGIPLKYRVPIQASADGNTVEMDVERAQFAENAIMYEFSLDRLKGHFMMMGELFKNLKD